MILAPNRTLADHAQVYSDGRTAIDPESSLVPLICSTNGLAESSYFMVLRMPSQSVAPLKPLGFTKCPSCTTSTQPPAERLMVYRPAFGAFLKFAKPANVPSLGARSGGEGNFASPGMTKAIVIPVEGSALSSPPDTSLMRSGAVS